MSYLLGENLIGGYGTGDILKGCTISAEQGEISVVVGPNGAGKSTAMKAMLGMLKVLKGKVTLAGQDITIMSPQQRVQLGMAFVPQTNNVFSSMTVEENLQIGALRRQGNDGVTWTHERVFEQFPRIKERLHARADSLSGGEQQMVAIARALVGNVHLLLMDEPFEGLSPVMIEELFEGIDKLRSEVSIMIVEHQLDLVLSLADTAFVLDRGAVSHVGPAKPLLDDLDYRKEKLWIQ